MSAMNDTPTPEAAQPVVYVRPVAVASLPAELQAQAEGIDTVYALHDEGGERLALVRDRGLAFIVARQNELTPVSVH